MRQAAVHDQCCHRFSIEGVQRRFQSQRRRSPRGPDVARHLDQVSLLAAGHGCECLQSLLQYLVRAQIHLYVMAVTDHARRKVARQNVQELRQHAGSATHDQQIRFLALDDLAQPGSHMLQVTVQLQVYLPLDMLFELRDVELLMHVVLHALEFDDPPPSSRKRRACFRSTSATAQRG